MDKNFLSSLLAGQLKLECYFSVKNSDWRLSSYRTDLPVRRRSGVVPGTGGEF